MSSGHQTNKSIFIREYNSWGYRDDKNKEELAYIIINGDRFWVPAYNRYEEKYPPVYPHLGQYHVLYKLTSIKLYTNTPELYNL